jgi:hypothetical protein
MNMKKLISTNLYKASAWCLIGILGLAFSSCIEDGENEIEGKGTNFIRIIADVEPESEINFGLAAFEAVPSTAQFLEIRRDAISPSDLAKPVTVNFTIDNTIVDAYNAYVDEWNAYVTEFNKHLDADGDGFEEIDALDEKDHHVILDPSLFSVETNTVTFAAGEFVKYVKMTLDPSTMDFALRYSLGVKFTADVPGYKYTSAGNNVLMQIVVKNQWDGVYAFGPGKIQRFSGGALNPPDDALHGEFTTLQDRNLVTRSANEVYFTPLWATGGGVGGIDGTYIIIDQVAQPDGKHKVTMACETNITMVNITGDEDFTNTYDPATKTFSLAFEWGTANKRTFRTQLKYKKSR